MPARQGAETEPGYAKVTAAPRSAVCKRPTRWVTPCQSMWTSILMIADAECASANVFRPGSSQGNRPRGPRDWRVGHGVAGRRQRSPACLRRRKDPRAPGAKGYRDLRIADPPYPEWRCLASVGPTPVPDPTYAGHGRQEEEVKVRCSKKLMSVLEDNKMIIVRFVRHKTTLNLVCHSHFSSIDECMVTNRVGENRSDTRPDASVLVVASRPRRYPANHRLDGIGEAGKHQYHSSSEFDPINYRYREEQ